MAAAGVAAVELRPAHQLPGVPQQFGVYVVLLRRLGVVALAQLLDHPDDQLGDRRGIAGGRGLPPLRDDLALLGHERARDLRSADVDSDGMHERRV